MISVIVPIYNVEKYLNKCIKSIMNQTYKDIEIILINDNSEDKSYELCVELQNVDKRIKVINLNKNHGVSYTRNVGIDNSNGEYLIFIDADDFIDKRMLEELLKNIRENDADISICNFLKSNENSTERVKKCSKNIKNLNRNELLQEITGKKSFQGFVWNKLYKKEIIDKYGIKFDERITICEDLLFNCEYISKIRKGTYNENKMYHYIQRKNSAYNGNFNCKWFTVLEAYNRIFQIYKNNDLKNYIGLKYNFLIANLDLKEKITKAKMIGLDMDKINYNINLYFLDVLKSKYISNKEKVKLIFKAKFIRIFIIIKKIF